MLFTWNKKLLNKIFVITKNSPILSNFRNMTAVYQKLSKLNKAYECLKDKILMVKRFFKIQSKEVSQYVSRIELSVLEISTLYLL